MTTDCQTAAPYRPVRTARSTQLMVRGLDYHVRSWGAPPAPPLVLLHGARDTSASFQFVVDALRREWHVVAPDWRGHGRTAWTPGSYWHAEFMADLDAILDVFAGDRPVTLVGHSMGGNIASIYAGTQPHRVARLVMLDALGELLHRTPVKVDDILRLVIASRQAAPRPAGFAAPGELAERLQRRNARLPAASAIFLANAMARARPDGGYDWPTDPSFRRSLPSLHTLDEWGVVWQAITAPVLLLRSSDHRLGAPTSDQREAARRMAFFRDIACQTIPHTGHNLHHDAPETVAQAIEDFAVAQDMRS